MSLESRQQVIAIKRALSDPTRVLEALGIMGQGRQRQKQAAGWVICCPVHADRTPSCSVQQRKGELVWKCHGCQAAGDVLTLVAVVRGLSMRGRGFRDVLAESARLGGLWDIVDALERGEDGARNAPAPRPVATQPRPEPSEPIRDYPTDAERFWRGLELLTAIGGCADYLWSRGINADAAEAEDVVRAIPDRGALPAWARYRGQSWRETGHRLVVPMWDASGVLKSVRAWRIVDNDTPKRLPPGGHKSAELVMADSVALAWLRGEHQPKRIVISEGEPDFCVWATRLNDPKTAVIGIVSGSWCPSIANMFPVGCHVDVRTDQDEAGDRYAYEIESALRRRCFVHWTKRAA